MSTKRYSSLLTAGLASSLALSGCAEPGGGESESGDQVIQIGHLPITHAAPAYFLDHYQDELLDDVELELIQFNSWIELMDALNTGRIDGASVLFELAMKARSQGIEIETTALGHREGNPIIVDPEVDSVEDLKGETVAIPHTLSAHNLLLEEMLTGAGLDYEDVEISEMPPPEMPAALSEGRVASYVVAEPFGALGVENEIGKVMHQSSEFCPDNCLCCAFVLREDTMEAFPEATDELMEGYLKASERAGDGSEESMQVHADYLPVDEGALELSLDWISYDDLDIREDEYAYLREKLVEMELVDGPPSFDALVNRTHVQGGDD
ncbi:NitT/TauT family transport system substrate-binding protein [Salsuginibacillus halophilus]|uniref:NitT/TauT family transport system substrate-binding protein n=1 Tax=Salsuginibacillus halophilus TaxID=517424 RepID=A0A2P8HHX5_9BACI|nr:ABC transporter substrate-binding protein [Salsuginibacillus halophilus]PSL45801.1 NitT/TauT family transport system substrate-binding protein [Salsuginibacillus halophilus]